MSKAKQFWNKEYGKAKRSGGSNPHLALSTEPAEDLVKFAKWLERREGRKSLNVTAQALDLGCGNGRNLLFLSREYGVRGVGYDISETAIAQAQKAAQGLPLRFEVRSLSEPIPLPDSSVTLALDMMSSHVLLEAERRQLRDEIFRVLRPGGWLFFRSFLLEEDLHAKRLLKESPGPEEGMYIHPEIGAPEYVWAEDSFTDFYGERFAIEKIDKSFKHRHEDGSAWKRRTLAAYLQKS